MLCVRVSRVRVIQLLVSFFLMKLTRCVPEGKNRSHSLIKDMCAPIDLVGKGFVGTNLLKISNKNVSIIIFEIPNS